MQILFNQYGIMDLGDIKELRNKNFISYSEEDFILNHLDTLWFNITRKKTKNLVIKMEDKNSNFNNLSLKGILKNYVELNITLVFSDERYKKFTQESKIKMEEMSKKEIKELLNKYEIKFTDIELTKIFNKKMKITDLIEKENLDYSFGI